MRIIVSPLLSALIVYRRQVSWNQAFIVCLLPLLVTASGCDGDEGAPGYIAGEDLPSSAIGDATRGQELFNEKSCANCHSYEGAGGEDAPPLDFMKDKLSAAEVANMSGTIWNHLPAMVPFFEAEAIPVPTFAGKEMPDLIAYLHGGSAGHDATGSAYEPGADLPSAAIGDAALGKELFNEKSCSDCHSYEGVGGADAPQLDFMTGNLSAAAIAGMSGNIWNHMPHMVSYFEAEGIVVPIFVDDEMPDLIAFLHGGSPK